MPLTLPFEIVPMSKLAEVELIKGLGPLDATMLIMGSMIGSGIFIVSADIAKSVQSPGLLLFIWAICGLMTIMGALNYGELAAAMPQAGGQYVFLKEAYGPIWGFLYGWTLFLVIQTGTIAAVAVGFARYLDVFVPLSRVLFQTELFGRSFAIDLRQVVGVGVILVLSYLNCFGIRIGAQVQNLFTFLKVLALLILIVVGLAFAGGSYSHFFPLLPTYESLRAVIEHFQQTSSPLLDTHSLALNLGLLLGVAMIGALFSLDAWNNVTFAAGEVKEPHKTLPLSLFLGTFLVSLIFLLTNVAYLHVLPVEQIAGTDRIAATVARTIVGPIGNGLVSFAILVSTFGCLNGLILSGPRVYYAMAKDQLFFSAVAEIHPQYHTPVKSLWAQAVWASLLTLSGTYGQLLTYVISAALLFYALTGYAVIVLRRSRPELRRPYRTFGYPYLTVMYVMMAAVVLACNLIGDPKNSWPGFVIIGLGLPAYIYWKKR
jgi:APA family basic amino acid/polyamine antiporter